MADTELILDYREVDMMAAIPSQCYESNSSGLARVFFGIVLKHLNLLSSIGRSLNSRTNSSYDGRQNYAREAGKNGRALPISHLPVCRAFRLFTHFHQPQYLTGDVEGESTRVPQNWQRTAKALSVQSISKVDSGDQKLGKA
ncbi:hypothetical protein E4U57_004339 [Claviceps arundinis]|uniref:Uncharacterized protein n=1 Tax=Claviceps arundinis TaxID=1623583 RepID=A0ABQ7P576_9HYPO|nr:hypothetical protein E4U57_004339 [Claviceps arundinis]